MTDPTPPGDSTPPAAPPPDPTYAAPDPYTPSPVADPYVPPGAPADPYSPSPGSHADPYAPPGAPPPGSNPYATPSSGANPYATPSSGANPYATPGSAANPYATPQSDANPYATPGSAANPYATPSSGPNPYATPGSGGNPYATPGAESYAPPVSSPDPYGQPSAPPQQQYGAVDPQAGAAYGKFDQNPYAPASPYGVSGAGQPANYPVDYGYGNPYVQPGFQRKATDGMAIASLVTSCASVFGLCLYGFGFVLAIVGAILGHVSRKRIRQTGAGGDGMALAGIIVGWSMTGISAALIALFIVAAVTDGFS